MAVTVNCALSRRRKTECELDSPPLDSDLAAIAGLSGTGILRRFGVDSWSLDTSSYALSAHNHDGAYSATTHNHDATYSPLAHTHSYQAADGDLLAIAGLTGTSGFLKKTGTDTWTLDTQVYALDGHTHTFAALTSKPTTLAGYGITNVVHAERDGTDVNNWKTPGFYGCGNAEANRPGNWTSGFVTRTVDSGLQLFTSDYVASSLKYRAWTPSGWTAWKTQIDSGNIASQYVTGATYQAPIVGTFGNWNTHFTETAAHRRSWTETNSGGPSGSWWFIENMRHSNGGNYWGCQYAHGWEDNAGRLCKRNVTNGTWNMDWVEFKSTRTMREVSGGTLSINATTSVYTGGGALTMYLPAASSVRLGDFVTVLNLLNTWGTYAFTIAMGANDYLQKPDGSIAAESLVCDTNRVGAVTLTVAYTDGYARWAIS